MKKILFILFLAFSASAFAQTGIGTTTPNASAQLDVSSTTKGFLPPRMTTAERDAISSPATGLQIFNTTTNQPNYYNGTNWETKAYYCKTLFEPLFSNAFFNSWDYSNASTVNFVGNDMSTAIQNSGFERVFWNSLKNVSGRTITIKIDMTLFIQNTASSTNKYNPYIFFGKNGTFYTSNLAAYQLEPNSKWHTIKASVILTLNNNDYFDVKLAIAGGWTAINLNHGYTTITEI